jgi:hypothetical protein
MRNSIRYVVSGLIKRSIRFYIHESLWWPVGVVAVFAMLAWRFRARPGLLVLAYAAGLVAFAVPWMVRRRFVLRYSRCRRALVTLLFGVVAALFAMRAAGYGSAGNVLFTSCAAFTFGFTFWTVTDDMYAMAFWLAHPLEYGRPPDEIHLLAQKPVRGVVNRLWRYRYDDRWDVGITGVVTFAFEDGHCNSMTPDQMFAEYLGWYDREGIEKMLEEADEESEK